MKKRKITNLYKVDFKPFDNYGKVIPGMSWHKISYSRKDGGNGTYILKMDPVSCGVVGCGCCGWGERGECRCVGTQLKKFR